MAQKYIFIINLMIGLVALVGMLALKNPLFALMYFFILPMPMDSQGGCESCEVEDDGPNIGFHSEQ